MWWARQSESLQFQARPPAAPALGSLEGGNLRLELAVVLLQYVLLLGGVYCGREWLAYDPDLTELDVPSSAPLGR